MISAAALVKRTAKLVRRRRAARRLGVRFQRAGLFTAPGSLRLNGRDAAIDVPSEHGQRVAFIEILLDDCYGLRQLSARSEVDTIVDIGANIGLFTLAARAAFPRATIHGYEPNPALKEKLDRHADVAGAEYFLEAVGREPGYVSLDVQPGESVQTRSHADPHGSIRQTAFREVLGRIGGRAALVKMDCEGAEWEILADHESWQRVDFLTAEYHLGAKQGHEAILSAIREIGFVVRSHMPSTTFGLVFAERSAR